MSTIRVVLADDHALARRGVRSLLTEAGDIEIVAEAADGVTALTLVETHRPDVLVTDIEMPGLGGLELTERVFRDWPATKVLIISMHKGKEYATKAITSGMPATCSRTPAQANSRRPSAPCSVVKTT